MTLINRRDFLRLAGASVIGATGVGAYSTLIETQWVDIERVTVRSPLLPSAFDGLRIAQLSDIHLFPYTELSLVERAVAEIQAWQPDLVALTGDYVYTDPEAAFELGPVLAKLNPKFGVFAVLGNHDLWTDDRVVTRGFEASGIPMLRNQAVTLTQSNQQLQVVGLDDAWQGQPDLNKALDMVSSSGPVLILQHEPDVIENYVHNPRVMLQLSGHSHAGQVRIPSLGAPALPYLAKKYSQGLYQVQQAQVYTNRGLGVTALPVRFACRPEVTFLTLTST